jgi:acyl dehydratase
VAVAEQEYREMVRTTALSGQDAAEPAAVSEARALIGPQSDRSRQQWNTEVTRDAIRHFCWGMGDDNPLFVDEEYANGSVLGALSAPGTFLFSIDSSIVFAGLAGTPTLHIGTEWAWRERVWAGDAIEADVEYLDCRAVRGRAAGELILQTSEATYRNRERRIVGTARSTCARIPPRDGATFGYTARDHVYSPEEMAEIKAAALAEKPRGALPRRWDDVSVGDVIGPLVKGPLSLVDMMCWYAGAGLHGRRAHRLGWREVEANAEHWRKSRSGAFEHVGQGHIEPDGAHKWGMPGPYDNGLQRTAWLGHLVTDWMGDAGFMKALSCRIERPNVFGDVTWLSGSVTRRYVDENGDHVVDLTLSGRNQLGEITTRGSAAVLLPSRESEGTL